MPISYEDYVNKKKKKKTEPIVNLGQSKNQSTVNNSKKIDTDTLIKQYLNAKNNAGKTTTKTTANKDSLFSAFNDGYDFGDISKTILKGGTKLGKAVVNTGKELVTNPVQTVKSFGVGIGSGINKADELINNATDDFFDWIVPGRKEKEDGLTLREFNELSSATDEKTKQKLLKEYEKKYGKNSSQYEMIKLQLEAKPQDKNILNWKYTDSDTYAKAQAGELSEGQENIYGIGENIGQMLPSVGVSAVASPLAGSGLFFTQSQQSYTEEALARGYDEGDARTYGLIMGGAEVLVERLGFDELGGLQKLSNSSIKKAMVGEGLEEFVMPYVDDVVTYTGFEDGYGWEEFRESSEEALEGAVMGATVGVIMSAGGRGLQKVDNVINKINSGQEITQEDLVQAGKEIQENEPQLLEEAMKQVPAVAREQLEAQKNDVTNEDVALLDDIAPVVEQLEQDNIPIQQAGEQDIAPAEMPQQASEQELKRQNYVSEAKETDSTYRKNLNEDASKYANNTKRTHEFVNTLSNISEATGENIRLTNNTSEEMVTRRDQLIKNYAKKKNISVEEATSKLKNTIIDAYNTGDGITINVNSPKALNRLVGHEITHSLEKTNEYSKLQKIAIEYAQTKQDYSDRVDVLESLYDGTNANIKNELTSDIVGDYLFTDQEFVNHLQKSDQNIFQKIYSEIKHLIKMATAGSKEARQLEQLKHSFEKAMAEHKASKTNKVTVQETKTKSATETESNTQEKAETVQEIETDEASKVSENVEVETKIEDNAKEEATIEEEFSLSVDNKGRKLTEAQEEFFEDSVVRDENGNLLTMYHGTSSGGYTVFDPYGGRPGLFGQGSYFTADNTVAESYTEKGRGSNKQIYEVYLNITKPIDMDGQANIEEWKQHFSKHIPEATFPESGTNEELYRFTLEEFENTEYDRFEVAEIMIETFQKMGYDGITHIGGGRFNQKDETRHRVYITFDSNQVKEVTNKKPTQDDDIRYSLSETTTDNQGRELSKEQQEYFKDSKVRDAEDRLLTVYHGTNNDFTIFDKDFIGKNTNNEGIFGKGFYFTEKKSLADGYNRKDGKVAKDGSGKTMELYLDMKNPFYWNDIDTKEKMESFIKETGMPKYVVRWNNTLKNQMAPITDIKAERKFSDVLQKNGYDGVIYKYEEGVGEYVVFNSNQIKNVDNTNPTDSEDIRYSLSEDNQGNKLTPAVQKRFENSKARDENGQLKVLYHGTATGEFTVFDKNKANPEGDWGAGFYLTDSDFDVENNYEDGGADFDNKVSRLAEQIEQEEDISYEEAETKAREQLYKGSYKISAYVNIEKPAIVGETYLFSDYSDNYNIEDFESEEEYYEAVDQLVADDIDSAIWEIEKQYDFYNGTDEIRNLLWEAYSDGGMEIQTLKDRLGELYLETDEGLVGHDVARIIIESLGYDGIIDPTVSTKWNMDMEEGTTHYIVFKPNQIKNISNENPTDNPDINMSLSRTDQAIAPVKDADVFGSDIALQEAIAPLQEKVEELTKVITDLQENIAPASFELAEEQRAETQRTMSDEDAPLTDEGTFQFLDEAPIEVKNKRDITYDIQNVFNIKHTEAREIYNKIASMPELSVEDIYAELEKHKQVKVQEQDDYYKDIQNYIKGTKLDVSEIKNQIADYDNTYRMANMGKGLTLANSGQSIDSFYQELNELYPNVFPDTVTAEADQLDLISQVMFRDTNLTYTETLDDDTLQILAEKLYSEVGNRERYKSAEAHMTNWFRHYRDMLAPGEEAPIKTEASQTEYLKSLDSGLSDDYAPYLEMAREINASNTEQTAENVSIKDELNRLDTMKAQEEKASENEPKIEKTVYEEMMENFINRVKGDRAKTPVQRVGKSKWRNFRDTTQRLFVNEMVETDNLAKETGNKNIKFKGDMLNSVAGEIEGEISTAQTDNYGHAVGKSLNGLFAPAKQSGLEEAFNHYLELQSNIDRHAQGKGSKVSLLESETLVKEYEKSYPQFKEWGKDVWNYGKNIRDNLVEAGLIDQEFSDRLGDMYPHYVPYIENRDVSNYYPDLGEMKAKSVIKRAKGGASNLLPIEEALTKYTFASKKAVRQNQFYQEIVNTLEDKVMVGADIRSDATDLETSLYRDETGNYLTAYFDGKQQSVRISDDLYNGMKNDLKHQIEGLEEKFALVTDPLQKISEVRRNLLTSWNPMFMIRNPIMDVQDAVFNSKYSKDFIKHYNIKTFIELGKANTETARQFLTLYGSGNAMGEFSSDGTVKNSNFLKGIQRANNIVELAPRFAEFKASLDNGASIQEAMYNSREVTTNFSRGGTITKALNKNGFTFLNVSVQGFDKFIRNFSGENGAKGVVSAVGKATLLGVLPAIFNELVFSEDEDEEYEALPDYIKDNYYIIKTGDGEFIRIPKGRILSVFGSAGRRTLEYLRGEEDAFEGFLKNANTQVGIPNPLDSNIFTPLIQAYGSENGEAWYGGDLVPSRLQDKAPEEQYDASTDKMSIWLGEKLGISPYKLNYVIDQYSGGIGDIFLPFVTEEATSDSEGAGMILAPFKDQFTANSTFDNKYASEIYTLSDEMDKLLSTTKETDEYKIQDAYLYSVTSEMGKLYAERREVQADSNLTKAEKYAKVQAIQEQINSLAKEGMENYQNISKTDVYAIVGGREFNKYTTDDGTERWGSVFEDVLNDLNSMGMDLDEKSEYFRATKTISTIQDSYRESDDYAGKKRDVIGAIKDTYLTGEQKAYLFDKYYGNSDVVDAMVTLDVDIDSYLDYESQNFEADKDASGKSISGSKKAKVFAYINSMNIDFEQRVILAKLQYPSYNEYNGEIIEYLNNSDMTYEQEVVFLEKLGFRVDEDGNIFW